MKCIFCKNVSDNCVSVEHIIPESLGNKDHILPKGVVCDSCNNYFAVKIEKLLMELPYFTSVRFRNDIESKKGRFPLDKGIIGGEVSIGKEDGGYFILADNPEVIKGLQSGSIKHMIVPSNSEPEENNMFVSKFLCKAALETLVYKVGPVEEWLNEIVDHPQLDYIRNYVRRGDKPAYWEYHQRRVYNEADQFLNKKISIEPYEILHEFDFIYSDEGELFFVLVIMGMEYVVSLAESNISGYRKWLLQNPGKFPLQSYDEIKVKKGENVNDWLGKKLSFYSK